MAPRDHVRRRCVPRLRRGRLAGRLLRAERPRPTPRRTRRVEALPQRRRAEVRRRHRHHRREGPRARHGVHRWGLRSRRRRRSVRDAHRLGRPSPQRGRTLRGRDHGVGTRRRGLRNVRRVLRRRQRRRPRPLRRSLSPLEPREGDPLSEPADAGDRLLQPHRVPAGLRPLLPQPGGRDVRRRVGTLGDR